MRSLTIRLAALSSGLLAASLLPASVEAQEICGNSADDNGNSYADEGCAPSLSLGICESPLSCAQAGAVAPKNGGIVYSVPADLAPTVPYGPSLTFERKYVSLYAPTYFPGGVADHSHPLGRGWVHSWQSFLKRSGSGTTKKAVVHLRTGQDVFFAQSSSDSSWEYYTAQNPYRFFHLRQRKTGALDWELKTLDGEVMTYNYTTGTSIGKLTGVKDALPTPNVVTVTYNAIGQVDKVTAAGGAKYLQFEYFGTGTKLLRYVKLFADTTLRVTAEMQYTSDNLTSVLLDTTQIESYTYDANNKLTSRKDGLANTLLDLRYVAGTAGKVATVSTSQGEVGYDYNHASCNAGAGTRVYFNRWSSSETCNVDADCGAGNYCGGKTATGTATGFCYRAWRCMTVDTTNEHLVTTVTGSCPSCVGTAEYAWNASRFLLGRKSADNVWTSTLYNSNGRPTKVVEGDTDSDANTVPAGIWPTWYYYGNASFPGKLTETRRKSALSTSTCDSATSTGCKRTIMAYTTGGLVDTVNETGFTYDTGGLIVSYNFTTDNNYDSKGR